MSTKAKEAMIRRMRKISTQFPESSAIRASVSTPCQNDLRAEHKHVLGEWLLVQNALHPHTQPIEPAARIRHSGCNPDLGPDRKLDHWTGTDESPLPRLDLGVEGRAATYPAGQANQGRTRGAFRGCTCSINLELWKRRGLRPR
jgi:hypothetical protein